MNIDIMAIPVTALQFAAFGWRINRVITVGEEKRKTWLPLANLLNIVMLLLIIFSCIVIPITFGGFYTFKRIIMVAAAIFIAFHPITTAGHYGLL